MYIKWTYFHDVYLIGKQIMLPTNPQVICSSLIKICSFWIGIYSLRVQLKRSINFPFSAKNLLSWTLVSSSSSQSSSSTSLPLAASSFVGGSLQKCRKKIKSLIIFFWRILHYKVEATQYITVNCFIKLK